MTPTAAAVTSDSADVALGELAAEQRRPIRWWVPAGRLGFVVLVLAVWQFIDGRLVPDFVISSPSHVAAKLVSLVSTGKLWPDVTISLEELALGYTSGAGAGIILGILLGLSVTAAAIFEPVISAVNGIPKVALAPLFLLWLGIGLMSKVGIASMSVFFVAFYHTYLGMTLVPKSLVDVLRLMDAGRWTIIRRVIVPSIMAPIMAGLRAGVPFAMIGVVVGEFVASDSGVGFYIRRSTEQYDSAGVFAGIIVLVVIILLAGGAISTIERRALRWRDA
jgi:ABC-type nitrate/sulfonate/bicarbonate transport system permease component